MQWYYAENGQQFGPVHQDELFSLIAAGRLGAGTLVWQEGMPGWMPFGSLGPSSGIEIPQLNQLQGYNMMNPTTSGLAISSLVCGIVGLVSCFVLLGIPAVVCGHMALHQIAHSRTMVIGRGMALAGLICGYLAVLIMASATAMIIFTVTSRP